MKRVLTTLGVVMVLAGCARTQSQVFSLSVSPAGQQRKDELLAASQRVVEGKAAAMKLNVKRFAITPQGTGATVAVDLTGSASLLPFMTEITSPFKFRIMKEVPKEQADFYLERIGGFKETGLTERHILGVRAGTMEGSEKGFALIELNKEGKDLLAKVYKENKGKRIGLFLRDRFISSNLIDQSDIDNPQMQIDGIPSPEVAQAFADDMNVGLHVTFVPISQ